MNQKFGLVLMSALAPIVASATTVIDTVGLLTNTYIDTNYARAGGLYQWGQSFSTESMDTRIQSVTVYFNAYSQPAFTSVSLFKWNSASGNPESSTLWHSGNLALSVDTSVYFVNASVQFTPNFNLTANSRYLLVFEQNIAVNGLINLASSYTDGDAFIRPASSPFSWQYSIVDYADMPVRIELSQAVAVPEVSTSLLFAAGIVALLGL